MAFPTSVNDQITDSISQAGLMTQGSASSVALGSLMVSASHALGIAAHNATANQQQSYIVAQAATVKAVKALLSK